MELSDAFGVEFRQLKQTSPEEWLWQAVVWVAVADAVSSPVTPTKQREQEEAYRWIAGAGRNFRFVCALAGMDPDFLPSALRAGRINSEDLKNLTKVGRR
ncbi:hypothetical protein [Thalassovita sp.]|uniref:hypothetical protein n=1 Tax=Thalassovita sp. TaxID=1979401 RepID=UPI002AB08276|nr:hypothetical protein [Thalassovita sp.]